MDDLDPPLLTSHRLRHRADEPSPSTSHEGSREEVLLRRPRQVFQGYSHLPDIKFRWCRSIRCRTPEVTLVLTSVTGTQVVLQWRPDLGWYESLPTPLPLGHHTGFLLIRDKVRTPRGGRLTRERDFKIDPFHVVPHCFAVELFITEDVACDFWGDRPSLRLRYLSSDHLVRLEESASELIEEEEEDEDEQATQQLGKLSTSSLGSSGLGLGYEAQGPPSQSAHFRSRGRLSREKDFSSQWQLEYGKDVRNLRRSPRGPYRYHSEEGLHPRRLLFEREGKTSRGRSLENSGRLFSFGESRRPLLAQTKDLIGTQLNLLRFSTLAQELQIAELLSGSRQSIEDGSPGYSRAASDPDLTGPYSCLITFESRSQSMDDLGSPRALEEALVSLTSCGGDLKAGGTVSLPTQEQQVASSSRSVMYLVPPDQDDPLASSEDSPAGISTPSEEGASPSRVLSSPSGGVIYPAQGATSPAGEVAPPTDMPMSPIHEQPSLESKTSQATVVRAGGSSSAGPPDTLERMDEEDPSSSGSQQQQPPFLPICVVTSADSEGAMADVEYEDENFQYESLQHEEEHIPLNVRLLNDSEDSTDAVPPERDRKKRRAQAQLFLPEDNGDYTTGNEGDVEDGEEVGLEDSEDTAADYSEKGLDMGHERDVFASQIEKIPPEIIEEKVFSKGQPQVLPSGLHPKQQSSTLVREEIEENVGDLFKMLPPEEEVWSPSEGEVLPPPEEEEGSPEDLTPVVPEDEDSHESGVSGRYSFGEELEVKGPARGEVSPEEVVLVKIGREEEEEVKEKDDEETTLSPQEDSEPPVGDFPVEGEEPSVRDSPKDGMEEEGEEPPVGDSPEEDTEGDEPPVEDSPEEDTEGDEPPVGDSPEEDTEGDEPPVGDSPQEGGEEPPVGDSSEEEKGALVGESPEEVEEEELPVADSLEEMEEEGEEASVRDSLKEGEEPPVGDSPVEDGEEPLVGDSPTKVKEGESGRVEEDSVEEEIKEDKNEFPEGMEEVEEYEDLVDKEERDTGGEEFTIEETGEGSAADIVDEGWEEEEFEIEKGAEESMEKDRQLEPPEGDLPSEPEAGEGFPQKEGRAVTRDVPKMEEEEEEELVEEEEAVEEEEEVIEEEEEEEVVEEEEYPVEDMRTNYPRDFIHGDDTTDISGDFMDLDRSIGEVTGSNSTRPPSEAVGYSGDLGGELGNPEVVMDRPSGTSVGISEKLEKLDRSLDKPRTVPSKLDKSKEKPRLVSDSGKGTSGKLSEILEKPSHVYEKPEKTMERRSDTPEISKPSHVYEKQEKAAGKHRDAPEISKPSQVSGKSEKVVGVRGDAPEMPSQLLTTSNKTLVRQSRASEKPTHPSSTPSRTLSKSGDRPRKSSDATSGHTKGVPTASNGISSKPNGKRITPGGALDKPRVLPVKKNSGSGKHSATSGKISEVSEKSRGSSKRPKKPEDKTKVDPSLLRSHEKSSAKDSAARGKEEPTKSVLQSTKNLAELSKRRSLNGSRKPSRSPSLNGVEDTEESLPEEEMEEETEDDHLFEEEEVEEEEEEGEESEEWREEELRIAARSSKKYKSKAKRHVSTGTQTVGSMKLDRSDDPSQNNNIDKDRYRNYSSSTITSSSPVRHRSSLKNKRGKNYFVPLPNKFNGPWSYGKNLGGSYPSGINSYSSSSVDLQTLQQNLYNLVQCDGSCIFNRGQTYANKAVVASFEPKKSQSSVGFDPVVQEEPKKSRHLHHHHHHHHHRTPTKNVYPGTSRPSITNGVASGGSPVRDTTPFSITRPRNGEPRSPAHILRSTAPHLPRTFAVTSSPTRTIEVKRGQTSGGGRSLLPRDILLAPGEMLKEFRSSNGDYRSHRHRSSGMPSADCGVTVGHASSMPDLHHAASTATPSSYQLRHSPSRPTHHRHHATPTVATTTPTSSRHVRAASTPPVYFQPSATRISRTYSLGRDYSWLAATGEESGGSTDSLIEEADRARAMAFQTPSYAHRQTTDTVYSPPYRRRRRRRTRSSYSALPTTSFVTPAATSAPASYRVNDSFFRSMSLTKASSETDLRRAGTTGRLHITGVSGGLGDGGLPYLPYRAQHLFMGQRVKVMAPGGVSQAKVISTPSSSAVTVMLLTEPNSWTGVVVTLPVEKVLIAWPRP